MERQLGHAEHGRVVEPDVGPGQLARGAHNAALLQLGLAAEAQALAADAGTRRRADARPAAAPTFPARRRPRWPRGRGRRCGAMPRAKLDLPTLGPRPHDDQVGALEAAEQAVEVGEARVDGGQLAALRRRRVLLQVGLQDLADVDEVAEALAAAQALDQVLGAGEDGVDVGGRLVGELEDAGGGVDEAAVGAVALDDAGVELDAHAGGQLAHDVAEEALPARLLQPLLAVQLVGDGDLVDRLVAVPEADGGLEDPGVALAEEVGRGEDGRDLVDGLGGRRAGRRGRLPRPRCRAGAGVPAGGASCERGGRRESGPALPLSASPRRRRPGRARLRFRSPWLRQRPRLRRGRWPRHGRPRRRPPRPRARAAARRWPSSPRRARRRR